MPKKKKGKRKRSSISSDSCTPSSTTPSTRHNKMATAGQQQQQSATPIANAVGNANQTLYGPSPHQLTAGLNVPPNTPFNSVYPLPQTINFSDSGPSPDTRVAHENSTLHGVLKDIYSKLEMLNILPTINTRLGNLETKFNNLETESVSIKHDIGRHENRLTNFESSTNTLLQECDQLKQQNIQLQRESNDIFEKSLEMQTRSMRENLIFSGIPEVARNETPEQSENELKTFIAQKLKIEKEIPFHVVHRLRPRRDGRPKSMVAKFQSRKDRNLVLKVARKELKNTEFGAHEQFPQEINVRRNELWPAFRHYQQAGQNVRFNDDKLIVNGSRIYPSSYRSNNIGTHNIPKNALQPEPRFHIPPVGPTQPMLPPFHQPPRYVPPQQSLQTQQLPVPFPTVEIAAGQPTASVPVPYTPGT